MKQCRDVRECFTRSLSEEAYLPTAIAASLRKVGAVQDPKTGSRHFIDGSPAWQDRACKGIASRIGLGDQGHL